MGILDLIPFGYQRDECIHSSWVYYIHRTRIPLGAIILLTNVKLLVVMMQNVRVNKRTQYAFFFKQILNLKLSFIICNQKNLQALEDEERLKSSKIIGKFLF